MQVGVNYPWFDYGWDFGLGPPAWRCGRTTPRWFDHVDGHLDKLHDLGIGVVRWFILADGLTYGSDDDAPRSDGSFEPPALDADFIEHFEELLRRFARTATTDTAPLQILPVLIDFHFCQEGMPIEPGWVKQGRSDAIRDPAKRSRFLAAVLDPLLQVSARHPDVIYAWELMNEPDWITSGWHFNLFESSPVSERAMKEFLEDGKQRIRAAGFKPTIGFGSVDILRQSGVTAEINQFHYYPDGRATLEPHDFDPRFPGILGEFATATTDIWPDLASDVQGVGDRLQLAAERRYPLAMPWSFLAQDRHTVWSTAVEEDIRSFTRLNAPSGTRT